LARASTSKGEQVRERLGMVSGRYGDDHPEMQQLRRELAEAEREPAQQAVEAAPAGSSTPAPVRRSPQPGAGGSSEEMLHMRDRMESLKAQLTLVNREVQTRSTDRDRILKDIHSYQGRVERLPVREQ